jgi:hypothetical protein
MNERCEGIEGGYECELEAGHEGPHGCFVETLENDRWWQAFSSALNPAIRRWWDPKLAAAAEDCIAEAANVADMCIAEAMKRGRI